MQNGLKSEKFRKFSIYFQGIVIVTAIFASGATVATFIMKDKHEAELSKSEKRLWAISQTNRDLRLMLRENLVPMRERVEKHTMDLSEVKRRLDEIDAKDAPTVPDGNP